MSYIDLFFDNKTSGSAILYTLLLIAVFVLGSLCQKKIRNNGYIVFRPIFFVMAFILLNYISFFCDVGSDLDQYRAIFSNASLETYFEDIFLEPGFILICAIVKLLGVNEYIGVGIIKCFILFIVFISIYRLKDVIHIGLSLMAYTGIVYFMSFNVLRICFAASFVLLAWTYIFYGKKIIACSLLLVSCTIHYSAVVTFLPFIFFILTKKFSDNTIDKSACLLAFFVIFVAKYLMRVLISENEYLNKYDGYLDSKGSFGLMQLLFYLPLLLCSYSLPSNTIKRRLSIILCWSGFAIAMSGYINGMVSRMNVYFVYNFMFLLPMIVHTKRYSNILNVKYTKKIICVRLSYLFVLFFAFLYLFYKFSLELPGLFFVSDIYPYKMWN